MVMAHPRFRVLYTDIGGVLGTNGWDSNLRHQITEHFGMDPGEVEPRHHLMFDSFERGYVTFDEYLDEVFFFKRRRFTLEELRTYTYDASTPWPNNIQFFKRIKEANRLKVGLISNEGQGITEHRVKKFGLRDLADFMVISHFVHFRKPDPQIWRLALNLAQADLAECVYVDDREIFVKAAAELGFTAVQYTSLPEIRRRFCDIGLAED